MFTVLDKLGYKSYHMLSAVTEPRSQKDRHLICWREALNYKVHRIGKPYNGADFDKSLQYHSVNMPSFPFRLSGYEGISNSNVFHDADFH
jgi:hypothetical protein